MHQMRWINGGISMPHVKKCNCAQVKLFTKKQECWRFHLFKSTKAFSPFPGHEFRVWRQINVLPIVLHNHKINEAETKEFKAIQLALCNRRNMAYPRVFIMQILVRCWIIPYSNWLISTTACFQRVSPHKFLSIKYGKFSKYDPCWKIRWLWILLYILLCWIKFEDLPIALAYHRHIMNSN